MTGLLLRLRSDRRGFAAVEFALLSTFLFGTLTVGLDFAFYIQQKLRLGAAIEQAAILAYNSKVTSDTSAISSYLQNYSGTQVAPSVAITCNGTNSCGTANQCSCITAAGGFTVAPCNAPCNGANSASAGNYLKIVATIPYRAVIVPNSYLGGSTITQSVVVRLS